MDRILTPDAAEKAGAADEPRRQKAQGGRAGPAVAGRSAATPAGAQATAEVPAADRGAYRMVFECTSCANDPPTQAHEA